MVILIAQVVAIWGNAILDTELKNHMSNALLRTLTAMDISDRNMQTWWDQFSISWAEYDLKIKQDPSLYCLAPDKLLEELDVLKSKVELVISGLEAKEEQLRQIRDILENADLGGKSGLHCTEDPEQPICKALDSLDKQAADERIRIEAQMKLVTDEITKVKTYPCDCTYNDWADNWSTCSVTCDVGQREEIRGIKWNKRNDGKDCNPKDAKRIGTCNDGCCPVDCVWGDWSEWTACPEKLGAETQFEHSYRSILVEHECAERGGQACEGKNKKSRHCNILINKNEVIAEKEKKIQALQDEIKGLKEGCKVPVKEVMTQGLGVNAKEKPKSPKPKGKKSKGGKGRRGRRQRRKRQKSQCYRWTPEDKKRFKKGERQRDVCESKGHIFTKGKNKDRPLCRHCFCCYRRPDE